MQKTLLSFLLLIIISAVAPAFASGQTAADSVADRQGREPFEFELYGFVRNDFTYDSRRTLASVCELFGFIPYDRDINAAGEDLNAIPSNRFVSITSRIGLNITSPLYNDFRFKTKIEADFCGQANMLTMLRIRQAYVALQWRSHSLLVGQAWHPMSSGQLPTIVSLNTGAPFSPFSRAPQLRYDASVGMVTLTAAAVYQFQYTSPGPAGNSTSYQVFGGLPEFYAGVTVQGKRWKVGAGAEYMQIKPANVIGDVKVSASVRSFAAQLYADYSGRHWSVKAKSVFGQNLAHLLMMSGYGEYRVTDYGVSTGALATAPDPNDIRYTPMTQSSSWLNVVYNTQRPVHNVRAGIFGGYMKNLGTAHDVTGEVYVRGFDNIDQMFRVSPSVSYLYRDLQVGLEYEYTGVMYGTRQPDMTVTDTHLVGNHRAYVILIYNFDHLFSSRKK